MDTLDAALHEVENIPAYLPNCLQLKDAVVKAKKWLHEAEALQVNTHLLNVLCAYIWPEKVDF